jgi:hypothetical protein
MSTNAPLGSTVGARLAERVTEAIIRATVDTRQKLGSHSKSIGMQIFTEATNHVSDEIRAAFGDTWSTLAEHPETDPAAVPLLHHLGHSRGQAFAVIGGAALGAAMGAGIMDLLNNWLAEPITTLIAQNPRSKLSAEQSAHLYARNIPVAIDLRHEAAGKGVNSDRFDALVALSQSAPPVEHILQLLNRGRISEAEARVMMHDLGVRPDYIDFVLSLRRTFLSPEQSAAGWARNVQTADDVRAVAARWGVGPADADVLMELAGEPPPLDAVISAWRRGIIDETAVDRAIIQGPIRTEWIPTVKALQEQPLPPGEAANAVTQGHLTLAEGRAKARLSGINEEDFQTIVETSGLPPGIDFAAEAFNRGVIDDAQWEAMFLESRIKNRYVPLMRAMRQRIIPAETVRLMYRNSVYPFDAALATLLAHGFTEVDARAQLALEDVRRTEGTRELTRAQIVQLFDNDIITLEQATGLLAELGYGSTEVEWMLSLAEVSKVSRFVTALVTRTRSAFLAGNIDATQAAELMAEAGVAASARDSAIMLWTLELEALAANLTTAQIQAAIRRQLLTATEAHERFVRRGYSSRDADVLVALATPAG